MLSSTPANPDTGNEPAPDASIPDASAPDVLGADVGMAAPTLGVFIDAAGHHTCAVHASKAATCWGHDYEGRLGTPPSSVDYSLAFRAPAVVPGVNDAISSFATRQGVYLVGLTRSIELGSRTPVAGAVVDGDAGASLLCLRTEAGAVECSGGMSTFRHDWLQDLRRWAAGLSGVAEVVVGDYEVCVRTSDGRIDCFRGHFEGLEGEQFRDL